MFGASKEIRHRLQKLENHLHEESPLLVDAVKGFKELDKIAYRLGLLDCDDSYTTQIPWWPLVSVLGTYSAGKSTFLNSYINYPLQNTGSQAVDEKFTVISYGNENDSRTLPGIALDADPRFPFYQMADELEKVAPGDGARVNAYLQLKTCPSEQARGYIFIDSPGFDVVANHGDQPGPGPAQRVRAGIFRPRIRLGAPAGTEHRWKNEKESRDDREPSSPHWHAPPPVQSVKGPDYASRRPDRSGRPSRDEHGSFRRPLEPRYG